MAESEMFNKPQVNIRPYSEEMRDEWDRIVEVSRNGTFLLRRGFVEYHADRFCDCSVVVCRAVDGEIIALLPASRHIADDGEIEVRSHGGLTYGGLVMTDAVTGAGPYSPLEILPLIARYYRDLGYKRLIYKPTPHIYHRCASEEDLYALWRMGAKITVRNLATVIYMPTRPATSTLTKKAARYRKRHGIVTTQTTVAAEIWPLLAENLMSRHNARMVHTDQEMQLLRDRFPDNIKMYATRTADGELVAAGVFFFTPEVVHLQYWGSTGNGKRMFAEDVMVSDLVNGPFLQAKWFDMGTSNEDAGRYLNPGLQRHKETYGGHGIAYDSYTLLL